MSIALTVLQTLPDALAAATKVAFKTKRHMAPVEDAEHEPPRG